MTRDERRQLEDKIKRNAKALTAVVQRAKRYDREHVKASPEARAFLDSFLDPALIAAYHAAAEALSRAVDHALWAYMDADG